MIVWSVRRTRGLSCTASLFSLSVIMYGLMYPLLNSIPSTTFSEVSIDLASSTVMTPSLPTASTASAIRAPISSSLLEAIVATCLIVSPVSTGTALSFRESTTVSIAWSNPAFSSTGLDPDSMFFRPWWHRLWASMDAVDVPSPALSWVLLATSWISLAPMLANGSPSSMSLAIVTPSLMIEGLPHDFSSTTVLAAGPRVTLTAFATVSIPSSNFSLASSP